MEDRIVKTITEYYNGSRVIDTNISGMILYYNRSDLAGVNGVSLENLSQNERYEVIYDPPFIVFDYPIEVGKEGSSEVNAIYKLPGMEPTSDKDAYQYKCLRKTDISTEIGVFDCYVIKGWFDDEEDNYFLLYISSTAGNSVKPESYMDGGF